MVLSSVSRIFSIFPEKIGAAADCDTDTRYHFFIFPCTQTAVNK